MPVVKCFDTCRWMLLSIALMFFLALPAVGTAKVTKNDNPWDRAFFTAPPSELLSAAKAVPVSESEGVIVLLDEGTFSFDDEGRCTSRYRLAYRILDRTGMDNWSSISARWSPWYQERPELRAIVVTPDGAEHILSGETIDDSPASESSQNIYSDIRKVRAPLPALTVGAVVEQEIVIREKAPYFPAGSTHHFYFGNGVRELNARLVLEYPAKLQVRHVSHLLPDAKFISCEKEGRVRITMETGPMEAIEDIEPGMPGDVPRWPNVAFTTGEGWAEVAARYGEIVESRIAQGDMKSLVKETVGDTTEPGIIAAKLLERLRGEVRYTGIEFGSSSIVPGLPEETLVRKYGDCKDQAALLIKMLRTAGVPAFMALIRVGTGGDVDRNLPGMGDFNHAIVYIPGKPAIWIDPTNRFRPAGELPVYDQDRSALIAGGPFKDLIVTPETPSKGNRQVETREFFLSEKGKARVIETTLAWGSIGAAYRQNYSQADRKEIRERLEEYARSTYLAEGISRFENSSPKNMGKPFRIYLEMDKAERGFTDEDEAVAALSPSFLAERLPEPLTGTDDNSDVERKHDYLIPESGTTQFGPMSLTREYRLEKDGSVSAILRFDTVKRRLTPSEFMAARNSLRVLQNEKMTMLRFEQTGRALLAAGKYREAIAEFRRLSVLHPHEALHHDQTAMALLEIGLGYAARKEAERAVALEPDLSAAHRMLAWILQHDSFGRLRRKGFDRNRAITEYRRAIALDPGDYLAHGDLAILLEFNNEGERYGRGSDLTAAVDEYRVIRNDLKRNDLDDNLLVCLYRSERWKELKQLAISLEPSVSNTQYFLLAIAGEEGAESALKEACRRIPDPAIRRKTLATVSASLINVRHYRDAASLLQEAAKGVSNTEALRTSIKFLKSTRRFEDLPLTDRTPVGLVKYMFLSIFVPEAAKDDFLSLFARPVRKELRRSGYDRELMEMMGNLGGIARKRVNEAPREVVADLTLNNLEFHIEGSDAEGYRVDLLMPSFKQGYFLRLYITKEDGKYRIITNNKAPNVIGLEVLRLLDSGQPEAARTWLNWARDEISLESDEDPLSAEPFPQIWTKDSTADPGRMRLAAACLLAGSEHGGIIPILAENEKGAIGELRTSIDSALVWAYLARKKYPDLLRLCDRLGNDYPLSPLVFRMRVRALRSMNRLDEVREVAEARLKRNQQDPEAMRMLAQLSQYQGKLKQAEEFYRKMIDAGNAVALDFNNLAWLGLFHASADGDSLKLAEHAVELSNGNSAESLHTLAALYAASGKTAEARETILREMEISGANEPTNGDWYVEGLIAEQYGEKEAAVEAYEKVDKPAPGDPEADSPHALARKRLLKLTGNRGDI
jgi:tetratricopeptide (TPR) repeat protein